MATYKGTMSITGDVYSSTAGGYQIGGRDQGCAYATLTFPSTYTSYKSCSISCTLYSKTAPSNWNSSWGCDIGVYKNGRLYGGSLQTVTRSHFTNGSGPTSRGFTVNLTGGYFESGDEVMLAFYGENGEFVDSSNRCVYLRSATFTSSNATNIITLSFNSNGGSGAPKPQQAQANSSGIATFTIPTETPIRNGYRFLGWSLSSSATSPSYYGGGNIQLTEDGTLYACWTAQTYTISYNANGGSGAPGSQTKTHGVTLTLSSTKPTRVGYEFLGWATSPTATSATYSAGGSYTINEAATLYAVWKAKEYSVLYNGNGGTHSITGSETWEDTTNKFTFGKEYNISLETLGDKDFKYPGYNLLGWNTSGTATEPLTTLKIEKDEQPQLYAIWELGSNIRVYTNENWQIAIPYIYENGEWKLSISKVFNNGEWRQ